MRPYLAIISDSFHSALASRVLWAAFLAIWVLLASLAPIGIREDYTTSFRWFDVYNGTRMKALLAQGIVDPDSQETAIGRVANAMPDEMKRQLRRVGEGDEVRIRLSLLTNALNDLIESDATKEAESKSDSVDDDPNASNEASVDNPNPDQQAEENVGDEPALKEQSELDGASDEQDSADDAASDWYDAEAWESTVRLRELRSLDETPDEELSESLRRRRARLRIEAALPGVFESRSSRSVLLTYAGLEFPTDFQIDRVQFETLFNQFVIPILVNWLLGLVLVFLGVLVTASIVPDMLQTGSLHLLLSKPISRSALLISKFIGGCAFVLLCVSQLVVGLYLIAAFRLGVWNTRILWCIPVAVVIFAVFYSVSVLAGLKWRSAIISIAAAGALAAICVVVGVVGGVVDARVVAPDRIIGISTAGDELFGVTGGSGLVRLDPSAQKWEPLIESEAGSNDRVLRPAALDDDHVMTARIRNGRFNPFGSGSLDLIVLSRDEQWQPQPSLRLPTATERLLMVDDDTVLAINTADLLTTERAAVLEAIGVEDTGDDNDEENGTDGNADGDSPAARIDSSVGAWLKALVTMQGGATESFVSILPSDVVLSPPTRVAKVLGERSLVLLTGDRIQRLEPTGSGSKGTWKTTVRENVAGESERASHVMAASSRWVVVARGDLPVKIYDAATLDLVGVWDADLRKSIVSGTPLELVAVSEDLFLLRTSSGHCDVIEIIDSGEVFASSEPSDDAKGDTDVTASAMTIRRVARVPVDEVESMYWKADAEEAGRGTLYVVHDIDRVSKYSLLMPDSASELSESAGDSDVRLQLTKSVVPAGSVWRWVDRYVVGGLELFTPQVLQLGDTTAAMVSGNDSLVIGGGESGAAEVVRYQIAWPLISCSIFIAVVLAISCVYFSRSDY
ncbi:ABC transporter permease [Rhodopirellula sallentina]|uniref:Putative membrane protein n=1 Tax=Rhodopirellula sallentina SM41 TaxID=1263870 RepID=M5U0R4_9BACT|nr:ABC transporter permease [Rhodopirellula sallentina]EMI55047.1 putative membrane protein [Rhodopirellula sallentina SM41]